MTSSIAVIWKISNQSHENLVIHIEEGSDLSQLQEVQEQKNPNRSGCDNDVSENRSDQTLSASSCNSSDVKSLDNAEDQIPESVLQYERQVRKAQHSKKTGISVNSDEHLIPIYVDEDIVVVNKPAGVLTVPGINQHQNSSLLSLVYDMYGSKCSDPSHMVVHRLDMDTSGLVLFGRSLEITKQLHEQFRTRQVDKVYECLVMGHLYFRVPSDYHGSNEGLCSDEAMSSGQRLDSQQTREDVIRSPIATIDLPLQRDLHHPPFMRVSTSQSEKEALEVLQHLQKHGWKKLVRKRPKPSQTLVLDVVEHAYFDGNAIINVNGTTDGVIDTSVEEMNPMEQTRLPYTRLRLKPITGRTHQLRVHCAALGYPIVGDPTYSLYGEASPVGGLANVPQYWKHVTTPKNQTSSDNVDGDRKNFNENTVAIPSCDTSTFTAMPQCPIQLQKDWTRLYPPNIKPMCLHARTLQINHPTSGVSSRWDVPPNF